MDYPSKDPPAYSTSMNFFHYFVRADLTNTLENKLATTPSGYPQQQYQPVPTQVYVTSPQPPPATTVVMVDVVDALRCARCQVIYLTVNITSLER